MPTIIEITDLSDPALDVFARLTENQLRNRLEPERAFLSPRAPKSSSGRWTREPSPSPC